MHEPLTKNSFQAVKSLFVVNMIELLVQRVDQLEQVVISLLIHGQVTQLINDHQIILAQGIDLLFQFALQLSDL